MPSTNSSPSQKLDAFPPESLDAFDWNHWMTSIGISGCFRLESVDDLPRNTHPERVVDIFVDVKSSPIYPVQQLIVLPEWRGENDDRGIAWGRYS